MAALNDFSHALTVISDCYDYRYVPSNRNVLGVTLIGLADWMNKADHYGVTGCSLLKTRNNINSSHKFTAACTLQTTMELIDISASHKT